MPGNHKEKSAAAGTSSNITITEHQVGAWKFKLADHSESSSSFNPVDKWNDFVSSIPLLRKLLRDVTSVAPGLFSLYLVCMVWQGVEGSIMMHLSNQLLKMIEVGIVTGEYDTWRITIAIIIRLLCTVLVTYLQSYGSRILDLLDGAVTRHFELMILKAELRMDLSKSESTQGVTAAQAWKALEGILDFIRVLISTSSELFLIFYISSSSGGFLFALLCISRPLASTVLSKSFFFYVTFAFVNNPYYRRLAALKKFSRSENKQDIISGNMGGWIISEMQKTHSRLGTVSNKHPASLYEEASTKSVSNAIEAVLGDLPLIYCAINALRNPGTTSIASLAILQQSTLSLRSSFGMFSYVANGIRTNVASLRGLYALTDVPPMGTMAGGKTPYPPARAKDKTDLVKGMSLELRNVSFSYPGEQKSIPALTNVSIRIPAGCLVVIVGANGSGKSTLIRILSRLYDPTSGELLIDGLPAPEYRVEDLHEASVLLSQESKLYPLSLAENIGLGYPEHVEDEEMILDAAKKGGALKVIENLKDGLQTTLDPCIDTFHYNLIDNPKHPLYLEMESLPKKIDISGGEKQKIIASRAFMRFNSSKVKFVAVDEPSSALDAEAEFALFNNLRAARQGKTMIMVTHRFGNLTRNADLIICMKDGSLVECGTHSELMKKQGEYANLYSIQAEAFS
ncbi:P-loop containing nucleoside triphosphate hydrolase protein [Agrocybe pediades]|nr:P-loop containing nucleoside triphosphate hydrolase protein [Agrocybe pediades]